MAKSNKYKVVSVKVAYKGKPSKSKSIDLTVSKKSDTIKSSRRLQYLLGMSLSEAVQTIK